MRAARAIVVATIVARTAAAPALAEPPPLGPVEALAIGETFTLDSAALGERRRVYVYSPRVADGRAAPGLPVLYLLDGGRDEDFLHVAGLVQVSVGNGTMRPFLVVGVENTERRRDFTGPTRIATDREIAPRVGGSERFRRFMAAELMPAIESRYRTSDETAIVGESLAGLFVVETLVVEPGLFDTYVAVDPSLWWNDGELSRVAAGRLRAGGDVPPPTLLLATSGEPELARLAARLADSLRTHAAEAVRVLDEPLPEESHATVFHPAALRAFRRLFAPEGAPR